MARQGKLVLQFSGMVQRRNIGRDARDQEPQQQPHLARHACGRLLGHLGVIVGKADGGKGHGDKQHHPDERVVQPRPQQR